MRFELSMVCDPVLCSFLSCLLSRAEYVLDPLQLFFAPSEREPVQERSEFKVEIVRSRTAGNKELFDQLCRPWFSLCCYHLWQRIARNLASTCSVRAETYPEENVENGSGCNG
uniref:Uncharacterized protein n=1 Tax=Physcomitrium patens TaxID=3218 RepID=A0A2K1IZ43_PHYPA|nr:hypothetical protein PHYPA_024363 [Physcomitrium patens]